MSINILPNDLYTLMQPEVRKVRDSVLGSFFVKSNPVYLPHPSQVDKTSNEQIERYRGYVAGAEFPEFTEATLTSMLSKVSLDDVVIDLPKKINYLENDSNGDGLSLKGLMESCISNVLQVKWHLLLADFKGLTDIDIANVSIADLPKLNTRATINQYVREDVIDWAFARLNGRMQLTYVLLREVGDTIDPATGYHTEVISYLKLAIDDNGCYQQKITGSDDGSTEEGEVYPVIVGGKQLKFIPAEIVCDSEMQIGVMPLKTGFLTAVSNLAHHSYIVSADYKESLAALVPIVSASGVENMDDFAEDNGDRRYIASGAKSVNVFRNESAAITVTESAQSLVPYDNYFTRSDGKVRAAGGVYDSDATAQRTATEVINEAKSQSAILTPLVNSVERSIRVMALYCAMFEGSYQPDTVMDYIDDINISMPREFAIAKLTAEEVKVYIELYGSGLMPANELLKVLDLGGWFVSDAESIGLEMETAAPSLTQE